MRCLPLFLLAVSLHAADYDVLIKNVRVIDGTGNPWFRADVGVKEGRIRFVGRLTRATADRVIEGQNRILAPGFIDVHTHIEGGIEQMPRADNFLLDGVTTLVTGNCGGSRQNIKAFLDEIGKLPLGVNVATLVGHNTVRSTVMGRANRQATPEELARMKELVAQAMREGAVGISTGLIYIPGTYSNSDEVVALSAVAASYGGVYASHMRDEGAKVLDAIHEAARVGREAGMPVQLSHFKIDNKNLWGSSTKSLALVDQYRREGVEVTIDQYPYDHSSTSLSVTLPSWALADGIPAIRERLQSPETRARITAEMKRWVTEDKGYPDFSWALIASYPKRTAYEGKSISEVNAMKGRARTLDNEIQTIFDLVLEESPQIQMVFHTMGDEDIERIMRYPYTAVASDSGVRELNVGKPHPRGYGTNARVLGEYVRQRGVISLEDAIRRMTSLPAQTFRLRERGLIREGYAADMVLFDPAAVKDRSTYASPHQYSEGFSVVLVNGVVMVDNGVLTTQAGGKPLRRATAEAR